VFADEGKAGSIYPVAEQILRQANNQASVLGNVNPLELHDGAIELEPRFAHRLPNGGWDEYVPRLKVVHIPGDHLQIVDEPRIGKIGADLTAKLAAIAP